MNFIITDYDSDLRLAEYLAPRSKTNAFYVAQSALSRTGEAIRSSNLIECIALRSVAGVGSERKVCDRPDV